MSLTSFFTRSGKSQTAAALKDLQRLCYRLLSEAGTANSVAIASQVVDIYAKLTPESRIAFFEFMDSELAPDIQQVLRAARAYADSQDAERVLELQRVVEPPRQELVRRLNRAPGGTAAILAMRRDLLKMLPDHPKLRAVDSDFGHLLSSWFNPDSPTAARRLELARGAARENHPAGGCSRDQDWTDLEAPAAAGPPLLCLLSSTASRRAA